MHLKENYEKSARHGWPRLAQPKKLQLWFGDWNLILFACLSSSHVADIAIVLKQGQDSE